MKSREKLIRVIKNYVDPDFVNQFIDEIKPSIQLQSTGKVNSQMFSKLGGTPDLPEGIEWPKREQGLPLSFFAQFDMEELNKFDLKRELPERGILYFFHDSKDWDYGLVLYFETNEKFYQPEPPLKLLPQKQNWFQKLFKIKPVSGILKESGVEVFNTFNIPSYDSLQAEKMVTEAGKNIRQVKLFHDDIYEKDLLSDEPMKYNGADHRLLGNYTGIQGEYLQLEILNQIFGRKRIDSLPFEEILKWKLLFQFDSDRNLELNIADSGRIYFFIHEDDLKKQDFSKVRVVGDCY